MRLPLLLVTLAIAPAVPAAGTDDAVNERPPVTSAALEQHWQVDCRATWEELAARSGTATCPLPDKLVHQLRLCTYIYQKPGDPPAATCPDYRGALEQSQRGDRCRALADFMQRQAPCPGP